MERTLDDILIIKKTGNKEKFDMQKIITAVSKSAHRALIPALTDEQIKKITDEVTKLVLSLDKKEIEISDMHIIAEKSLDIVCPEAAMQYRYYRNYKQDFVSMLDEVYEKDRAIRYIGDKENSNTDSALVSTKRSLIYNKINKEFYKRFELNSTELQACVDGYIYVHDMSARRDTMNCCLFDMATVLNGGFEMGNLWYNEPQTLDTAFDVIGDITISTASQQYGGFTIPNVDKLLSKYAEKSYNKYFKEHREILLDTIKEFDEYHSEEILEKLVNKSKEYAMEHVYRDFEQGFQGWEYKFNSVGSSRGDYPFISISLGNGTGIFEQMATECCLRVRAEGEGKEGFKKPVLFPKIIFLYDHNLHTEGKELYHLFKEGIKCSSKAMYPDWLSLTGTDGYLQTMYKKYGTEISPMGCRAFLSPYYEVGGFEPADENDKPIFVGRWNGGAISLHLPMILAKSREENRDFFEVLDEYLEMIREIHKRTKAYLSKLPASVNPVAFCEGGFYRGHLQPNDKIAPLLDYVTFSYGITALNEFQRLYNDKNLTEDNEFSLKTMNYIEAKLNEFKKEDHILYAIYGTPAESLCGLQVTQFRDKYGIIKGVSDRPYVSNSFHCHVSSDITPIEKQDLENPFWDLFKGGRIQYCKYPINYNYQAISSLVKRAMDLGYYEGINLSLSYCNECGHEELDMDVCPVCGSTDLTKIDRMNGYLSYSRVKGETRLNDAKMAEIADRKSM